MDNIIDVLSLSIVVLSLSLGWWAVSYGVHRRRIPLAFWVLEGIDAVLFAVWIVLNVVK